MSYKGTGNNIYGGENFDPDFLEYLYSLPAEFLQELFMAWVFVQKNQGSIPIINIDQIHNNQTINIGHSGANNIKVKFSKKKIKAISNEEITNCYKYLNDVKIDITKLNKDKK